MIPRLLWKAVGLLAVLCTASHLSSAENLPDPPAPEKGVTFSTVYKIGSSSCKLESQDQTGLQTGSEGTVNVDGDDIVFRHNIKLQTPKCDCAESESFKSLLYRVNGLEEEVNYLKTQCSQGCCGSGGVGVVDTSCSGHGTYQHDICSCLCNLGWEGPDCSVSSCPDDCNDNGRCVDGKCVCHRGFTGVDCGQATCPGDCNDKGHCVDGKCVCFPHFAGEDCSVQKCPRDCVGSGQCVDGQCVCDEGFYGNDCSLVLGPKGLQLVRVTDVSLLVQWEPVRGAEYYILTFHPKDDEGALQEVRVPIPETSFQITGLSPGITYVVEVYAVIKGIQSQSDKIEATTDVSAIGDIKVVGQTDVSIQVDWKNPEAEVDHFKLMYTDPRGQEEEQNVQRSREARTKHTIVGLQPGTEYQIEVQVIKGAFEGKASSVTGVTDIDAPTNLVAIEVTEDTATVTWDRVQAKIDGYMLSYSSSEGSSEEIPLGADSAVHRLTGLRPGVLYTINLWAVEGDKASRKSSTQAETELDAPANLLAKDETETSFSVSWDRVQAEIDGYMLTLSSSEGSSEEIPLGPESRSHSLTGLRPGVLYTVYIWAVKWNKASRKSSTQTETELDAPTNLLAKDEAETSFSVSWDQVQAEIDGYMLTYSSSMGSSEEITLGPQSRSYSLTGLKPGVLYSVSIWAVKGDKASGKSSTQAETELDAPTNLLVKDVAETSVSVSWDQVQAEIDGYVLTYSSSEGSSEEIPLGPDTSHSLTGLRPGVLYTFYIWAVKGNKASRKSSTQAETELDAPTNLLAKDEAETSFGMSWDQVKAEIDGYVLTYSSSDGSSEEIHLGPDTSHSLTGLRPGVLYTVYIWAVKGNKASRKSSTQAETDIDAPRDLKATDVATDSASLTWITPLADIEGYILTYRPEDGSVETVEKQLGARERGFVASGLGMGKSYVVTLIAYRGAKRSKVVETIFKTVGLLYPFPMDCVQIMKNGNLKSGMYTVYLNSNLSKPIKVYCDMDTEGGGWLVLQRRTTGRLDFMKRWRNYIAGFGNMTDEFWLGLDKIYELTNTATQYELRFELGLGSERAYAVYDNFKIGPVKQKFMLTIGKYSGTAGDAMTYHQGRPWSTVDNDNDIALGNCALTHRGAWWYKNCHLANLNGKWDDDRHSMGVNWEPWKGHLVSLDFTEMKIRPLGALSGRDRRSSSLQAARERRRSAGSQGK